MGRRVCVLIAMGTLFVGIAPALLVSFIAAIITTFGLITVLRNSRWAEKNSIYFSAFAAGILTTTALRLIPEGLEATTLAVFLIPAGYVGFYCFNALFGSHEAGPGKILAPFIAIAFHSFIDGLEYGILFEHDSFIGLVASFGLVMHEFAEGVILFALLRLAGLNKTLAFILSFLGAALTTPAGALVAIWTLPLVDPANLGILISLAAGALLYVGTTHLVGQMSDADRRATLPAFCMGIVIAMVLSLAHHSVDHSDDHASAAHTQMILQ